MKIAFDATALYGRRGGIENALWQTFSLLRALDRDHDYLVFVPRNAPAPPPPFNPRWTWHRLPFEGAAKARRIAWQQLELPLWLRRERCDLLHAWNYVAPLLCPIPTILTVQDLIALDHSHFATRFNRLHYRALMPQNLQRAARVVVSTPQTQSAVLRRAPTAQVRVVPLGVDAIFQAEIAPAEVRRVREKLDLPPRFLLYMGNFEPKKNLPRLLDALQALPDAPPLVVAGGIKPWPRSAAALGGVRNLGFVAREDLPALLSTCQVFCFPSLCEGFGLPVLEALAVGAPVLASSAVPLPNLSSVAATPSPHRVFELKSALASLLSAEWAGRDPAKVARRRRYAASFTWEAAARATLAVYREFS